MSGISKNRNPFQKYEVLDNYGLLTDQMPKNGATYNFRAIRDYCRSNKKTMAEMTLEELEKFRSDK